MQSDPFKTRIVNVRIKDGWVPNVTDHFLRRYLQRMHGIDINDVRKQFKTDVIKKAIVYGATAVKTSEGTVVLEGKALVTFLDKTMRAKEPDRKSAKRAERLMQETA